MTAPEPDAGRRAGRRTSSARSSASSPAFNAAEVAAETGVTIEEARRLWRALGFPEHGMATAFTHADAGRSRRSTELVGAGLSTSTRPSTSPARSARPWPGWPTGRSRRWCTGSSSSRRATQSTGSRAGSRDCGWSTSCSGPFEELLIYAWRRHLAAAVARVEALGANEEDLHTTQLTVGFADIVGFTALSNQICEDRIGDLVELFESRCADVVAAQRGRVIKSIGDSVLFVNDDPIRAYDTAEGIINVIGRDSRMPDVRLGLASGSVVMRLGDVFGPPVNMAARLTAVARRNRIIIDAATAALLPDDQFETRRLPARPVRGFGLVEPVAVRRH